MSLEARMLKNITRAIDDHAAHCPFPPTAIALNPKARAELDWDEIRGLPIEDDEQLERWRFRVICERTIRKGEEAVVMATDEGFVVVGPAR